jgi:hypothetical protein
MGDVYNLCVPGEQMKNENRMRLAVMAFLEKRLKELGDKARDSSSSPNIKRFTLETYLTTRNLLERMKIEQETKAVQAAKDLWDQGF